VVAELANLVAEGVDTVVEVWLMTMIEGARPRRIEFQDNMHRDEMGNTGRERGVHRIGDDSSAAL